MDWKPWLRLKAMQLVLLYRDDIFDGLGGVVVVLFGCYKLLLCVRASTKRNRDQTKR